MLLVAMEIFTTPALYITRDRRIGSRIRSYDFWSSRNISQSWTNNQNY
jgi:hypothetical protein